MFWIKTLTYVCYMFLNNKRCSLSRSRSPSLSPSLSLSVCVCVCVFIFFHGGLTASCPRHTWEVQVNDLVLWIFSWSFCQVPSFSYLKMSYFTSKDETTSQHKLERKWCDILMASEKMIYIDIGYKSAPN